MSRTLQQTNYMTEAGKAMRVNLNTVAEVIKSKLNDEDAESILSAIMSFKGTKSSTKVTDEGVYCNYFNTYLSGDEFATDTNGKYKSNSILGAKIKRAVKTLNNHAIDFTLEQFRSKNIDAGKLDDTLEQISKLNSEIYYTVEEAQEAFEAYTK